MVCACVHVHVHVCRSVKVRGQLLRTSFCLLPCAGLSFHYIRGMLQANFRASVFPGFHLTTCVLGFQAHQGSIRLFLCTTGVELGLPGLLGRRFYSLSHLASLLFPFGSETSTLKISFRLFWNLFSYKYLPRFFFFFFSGDKFLLEELVEKKAQTF